MRVIKWYRHIVPIAAYADGQILGYRNGRLCKMTAEGKISNICSLSNSFIDHIKDSSRLLARLFRRDIKTSCILKSGEIFFFKDRSLFRFTEKETKLEKVFDLQSGMSTPMNIVPALESSEWKVLWGDYSSNPERKEVNIWGLKDNEKPEVVYKFTAGTVRHIHNIIPDHKGEGYFIFAGDNDPQAGIYYSDESFSSVEPVMVGTQLARAVQGFSIDRGIVYATDSVAQQNFICKLEKDKEWQKNVITPINGSCLYAAERGGKKYFSTTVESPETEGQNKIKAMLSTKRGKGILSNKVEVIAVDERLNCKTIMEFEKDSLPYKLFQYGAVTFPASQGEKLLVYPVGVKKYDGRLGIVSPREG